MKLMAAFVGGEVILLGKQLEVSERVEKLIVSKINKLMKNKGKAEVIGVSLYRGYAWASRRDPESGVRLQLYIGETRLCTLIESHPDIKSAYIAALMKE